MKTFVILFAAALFAQAVFVVLMLITGIGDGIVYVAYGTPYMILHFFVPLPDQIGDESSIVPLLLLCLPGILYALAVAGGGTLLYKVLRSP